MEGYFLGLGVPIFSPPSLSLSLSLSLYSAVQCRVALV